jgi:hypothetical protein
VSGCAPRRGEFGAVGNQQQHAEIGQTIDDEGEQLLSRRVDPVHVFDKNTERLVGGGGKQKIPQQDEGFRFAAGRGRCIGGCGVH